MGTMTPEHPQLPLFEQDCLWSLSCNSPPVVRWGSCHGAQRDGFLNSHVFGLRKCTGIIVFKERSVDGITRSESESLSSLDPTLV